jgi:hypothetical protein
MYLGDFMIQNNIGEVVSYTPFLFQIVIAATYVHLMAVYLCQNATWIYGLPMVTALAMVAFLAFSYVVSLSRYMYWVIGYCMMIYIIKALWLYRRRTTTTGVFLLVWTTIAFIFEQGWSLFGVSGTGGLSWLAQVWWIVVFKFVSFVLPSVIAAYTLYDQGDDVTAWVEAKFSHFSSRCACDGYPGDFLCALTILNDSASQKAVNHRLDPEAGIDGSAQWISSEQQPEVPMLGKRQGRRHV